MKPEWPHESIRGWLSQALFLDKWRFKMHLITAPAPSVARDTLRKQVTGGHGWPVAFLPLLSCVFAHCWRRHARTPHNWSSCSPLSLELPTFFLMSPPLFVPRRRSHCSTLTPESCDLDAIFIFVVLFLEATGHLGRRVLVVRPGRLRVCCPAGQPALVTRYLRPEAGPRPPLRGSPTLTTSRWLPQP